MNDKVKDRDIKNGNNTKIDEKSYKKYSYLLYWICDNQRICRNLQCKSFAPYFQKSKWVF